MKRKTAWLLAAVLIGTGMALKVPLLRADAESDKATEAAKTQKWEQHSDAHDIYGEVSSLEKRIKKDQATFKNRAKDENVIVMKNEKTKISKDIAHCRVEIHELSDRLDAMEKETPGSTLN